MGNFLGKSTKWHGKAKAPRSQYCHGPPTQSASAHLSYAGKPLVIYDQTQAATTPASTSSFLVSSSTFSHGQFPADHYNNCGVAHLPPPYFKPPDVQTFCLVQDRHSQPQHNSYYNISASNTCGLQTGNSNPGLQLPNLTPYAVAAFPNNQISAPLPVPSAQIFQTAPLGLVFGPPPREKRANSNLDVSVPSKCVRNKLSATGSAENHTISKLQNEWPPSPVRAIATSSPAIGTAGLGLSSRSTIFDSCRSSQSVPSKSSCLSTAPKQPEDRYSDESSASFDFTIEAEKMVSALCNTASSNDLGGPSGKDENRKTETNYFNGAGDNVANRGSWIADIEMDYPTNGSGACRAVGTQTQPNQGMTQQLPELIRKTTYWGCSEAEAILNSPKYQDPKLVWLSNISSATRTAITKSSTCFPVFTGDRTFANDLINALLRITNGWLILDNYLNKQHYPNVSNKFDAELTRCFQDWEESTYELLRNVIQTFIKLDEASQSNPHWESQSGSFPGDVSLYTQAELLGPPMTSQHRSNSTFPSSISSVQPAQESAYAVHYTPHLSGAQNFHYLDLQQDQKEIKPRSKWTITESSASAIDGTKSVPDVTTPLADPSYSGSKFRAKCSTPSAKTTSPQSLNAEFFDLRNKVMESNADVGYQWNVNSDPRRKADSLFGTKPPGIDSIYSTNSSTGVASLYTTRTANPTYEGPSTKIDPVFHTARSGVESVYFGRSSGGDSNFLAKLRMDTDYRSQLSRHTNLNYTGKILEKSVDSVYLGKSSTDQLELATVPRNKMTLLSQIELSPTPRKEPEQMAANLTAWFASMRTSNPMLTNSSGGNTENRFSESFRSLYPQESSRSVIDLTRQLQMDPNRQLQTIQNMQSIQSAPWNACNLINKRSNVQQVDEYDSSEDVRVYMKPGSYNVPKKRHQRRQNKRNDNSATVKKPNSNTPQNNYPSKEKDKGPSGSGTVIRLAFPTVPILQTASFSLENSPRTPRPVNSSASLDFPQDIAWKAACASAEILLEALNVKEGEVGIVQVKDIPGQINIEQKCEEGGASSYEASEDDSGSTCKLSPLGAESKESKISKTNVKTDSWLIRTLNNASIKQRKEPDLDSSESSNSSVHEDELTAEVSLEKPDVSLRRSQEPRDEDQAGGLAEVISRATYSETVRRCASGTIPKQSCRSRPQKAASNSVAGNSTSTQKSQRKESERSFSVHKSRKSSSKRATKDPDVCQNEESAVKAKSTKEDLTRFPPLKGNSKKKDATVGTSGEQGKNKSGDRGWSVWYSSRRRQSLSPMALKKLDMIHQTVWQMEEAEMFKYPPSSSMAVRSSAESVCVSEAKQFTAISTNYCESYHLRSKIITRS